MDFPKTSLIFYKNIRRHMLEDCKLYSNHSESFKSSTKPPLWFCVLQPGGGRGGKGPSFDYGWHLLLTSPPLVLHSFLFCFNFFLLFCNYWYSTNLSIRYCAVSPVGSAVSWLSVGEEVPSSRLKEELIEREAKCNAYKFRVRNLYFTS